MANEPDGPPPYTDLPGPFQSQSVNVLIVGETQQGKSTLVKFLNRYAGSPELDIEIGNGNISCTKGVGEYQISARLRRFRIADMRGNTLSGLSFTEFCDLGPRQAQVLEVEDGDTTTVKFMFVDTPGLDDSDGDDLEIMAGIVGRVAEISHINAVMYVRDINSPFSSSFQQFFSYIQRSMPSLSGGLIIIHSKYTLGKIEEFLDEDTDLASNRREGFKAATGLTLPHFFIDSKPSPSSPYAMLQSLNEIYHLLLHLKTQKAIPASGMKLMKTAEMQNFDVYVINALNELRYNLEKDWTQKASTAKDHEQNLFSTQRRLTSIEGRLAAKKERIKEIKSGPDIILGAKSCNEDYSFIGNLLLKGELNVGRKRVEYDSDWKITEVRKSCSSGSKWLDEDLRGTSWRATITANLFRDLDGYATFYTTSAIKNQRELKFLESSVHELEQGLEFHQETLQRNGDAQHIKSGMTQLGEDIEHVERLVEIVRKETFDVTLWPLLRRLYLSHKRPSRDDIQDFLQVYDERIAKLVK